jgi:hypothetical protein
MQQDANLKNNLPELIMTVNVYMIYQVTVVTFKQIKCGSIEEMKTGLEYIRSQFPFLA